MANAKKLETKNFNVEITEVDTESRIISGYAAIFNNVDADGDSFAKGAFTKSLLENGVESPKPRIYHLYQHNITQVLGRPTILKEDERGLYFETKIADTQLGNDVLQLYKEGVINEHSVGFQTIKSANRGTYREIQEAKLFEFSTVTFGANENTPFLGFKSQFDNPENIAQQFDKVEKMLKGEFNDETKNLLNIYLNQLKTAFLELTTKDSVKALNPSEDSLNDVNPNVEETEIEQKDAEIDLISSFLKGYHKN